MWEKELLAAFKEFRGDIDPIQFQSFKSGLQRLERMGFKKESVLEKVEVGTGGRRDECEYRLLDSTMLEFF